MKTPAIGLITLLALAGCGTTAEPAASPPTASASTRSPITEADLGVPFYPGSQEEKGGSKTDSPEASQVSSLRSTKDSPKKVADFYEGKVKKPQVLNSGNMSLVTGQNDEDAGVVVTSNQPEGMGNTTIAIVVSRQK